MPGEQPPIELRDLTADVADRLAASSWGATAVSFLRTARVQIQRASEPDDHGLRLAETGAYSIREALVAVTGGTEPEPAGLAEVLDAWDRFVRERGNSELEAIALDGLAAVIERNRTRRDRDTERARRLITHLERQTGLSRFPGVTDPVADYKVLLSRANGMTHSDAPTGDVADLYMETLRFFERLFMAPAKRHDRLVALGASTVVGTAAIDELRMHVARNAHDLALFFTSVGSSAWIEPLWDAGLIELPQRGEPWPFPSLIDALGSEATDELVAMLERLHDVAKREPDVERRLLSFDAIARSSRKLGSSGVQVGMAAIQSGIALGAKERRRAPFFKYLAVEIANEADPSDDVVATVADLTLSEDRHDDFAYRTPDLLRMLHEGMTATNAMSRLRMVTAKVRRIARARRAKYLVLNSAPLSSPPGDRDEPLAVLAHGLSAMFDAARTCGVATATLMELIDDIDAPIGPRLEAYVLLAAQDVPIADKIAWVADRLEELVPTGDDILLVDSIVVEADRDAYVEVWRRALGTPSPRSPQQVEDGRFPEDWLRTWRWSAVLPGAVSRDWVNALSDVRAKHGSVTRETLLAPFPSHGFTGSSPYSVDELHSKSPLDAASLIATWRINPDAFLSLQSPRELGRELEEVVRRSTAGWTEDPEPIIRALRHPTYVDHYFRGVTKAASEAAPSTARLVNAARLVATHPWDVETLGRDDFEYDPNWTRADAAAVAMLEALANHDGAFADSLHTAWELTTRALRARPTNAEPAPEARVSDDDGPDPLSSAINRPYSSALETVVALGWWEHRHHGVASTTFLDLMDEVIELPGWIGLEFRAIIAQRRPALEAFAREWLTSRQDALFGSTAPDSLGDATFDLTVKWSNRSSDWFLETFRRQLYAAARRQVHNACASALVAMLHRVDGYDATTVLDELETAGPGPVAECAEDIASLVQWDEVDANHLELAIDFWKKLLDRQDQGRISIEPLIACGRWALVTQIDDQQFQDLLLSTLLRTGGDISYEIEVMNRLVDSEPSSSSLRCVLRLLDARNAEAWDRQYLQTRAVAALSAAAHRADLAPDLRAVRDRLLEFGYAEARDIPLAAGNG